MFHLFPVMILSIWKHLIFHNLSITDHNSFCLAWFWRHLLHLQVSYLLVTIFRYYINCILADLDLKKKKTDIFLFEYFKVYKGEAPMLREELGYFTHMFHNWPLIIVGDYNSNLWLICYLYGKYRIHAKLSSQQLSFHFLYISVVFPILNTDWLLWKSVF